jgi:hypothetical protein
MKLFAALIFCFLFDRLSAQAPYSAGGRADAMAGSALFNADAWAVHNNPACLTTVRSFTAGVWCTRKYNVRELSNGAIGIAFPVAKATVGLGFYSFGMSPWLQQQKLNIAMAMGLAPKVNAGVSIHLLRTALSEPYGSVITPIAEVAANYEINTRTTASVRFWNIYPVKMADWQNEGLPTVVEAAINRKFSKQLMAVAGLSHESGKPLCIHTALDYKAATKINLQAGFRSSPAAFGCGVGFKQKQMEVHLAFLFQQVLGTSPGISFLYLRPDAQ